MRGRHGRARNRANCAPVLGWRPSRRCPRDGLRGHRLACRHRAVVASPIRRSVVRAGYVRDVRTIGPPAINSWDGGELVCSSVAVRSRGKRGRQPCADSAVARQRSPVGTVGTKIAVQSSTECGSPSWFGSYDPATNTTQKIVPDVPGELGVLSALAFP